ncbi:periplasmic mannitol-binding protein of mannitol ABC transporter [Azotobacter vinelandii CA]|uniref:Periplasmic mannitol-binding protein of mannitol ABC transporter n=2 Tax=Azotobacter vinelandii TaxID=354 RepID=C1DKR2_AZOVD|nr:sugar ABC transporter substrate-binding protein [Azotobacter vinelandii]ACO78914.1 periplasmic mannitol-binding protein of mannitol ABC transporter [Azotobacter vinelandii DJ]AGK13745.1 periplasmic mannitol-binding protein of mannitol ABC transporter [Azotobacter vinelandii CA]AGK18330.1 periplasmic mannitol-binding protein of mannitol ABC transporter [Azotobacter vinelandii CA6]WKN19909.1 sugar ABC transporter substrate-binding protein [Azotobacter vinelandii]SFY29287.1 sorbitol-binding pr
MKYPLIPAVLALSITLSSQASNAATTVTIGTVNNADMILMQQLSEEFERSHPDIDLKWVVLEENTLRQRLTTDIATKGGQFDVATIGLYETGIWGARGWLTALENLPADYALDDILPAVRDGLSVDGKLYALPFYAESSMTYYRTDLFEQAGLSMPEQPTWEQIRDFAKVLHKPEREQYGICLRGKAGWGENMALVSTLANAFGARWFDEKWRPEFTGAEWSGAIGFYVDLLGNYGPPGASTNGFNENLALFNSGKCALWVDATVAGSFAIDKSQSKVSESVGFALAPKQVTDKGTSWLWAWSLAIPASSDAKEAATEFVTWATSRDYSRLVAEKAGITAIPPGTRQSTYALESYMQAAPFARKTLESLNRANPRDATLKPVPYTGIQVVSIPEFQSIATQVGKLVSGALTGQMSVEQAMKSAQSLTEREMKRAAYYK